MNRQQAKFYHRASRLPRGVSPREVMTVERESWGAVDHALISDTRVGGEARRRYRRGCGRRSGEHEDHKAGGAVLGYIICGPWGAPVALLGKKYNKGRGGLPSHASCIARPFNLSCLFFSSHLLHDLL